MTVYIVQKLNWEWNDEAFVLSNDTPIKAFESRADAEALCALRNEAARDECSKHPWTYEKRPWIGEDGMTFDVKDFYEVITMELTP
jgi:hypothetical protein